MCKYANAPAPFAALREILTTKGAKIFAADTRKCANEAICKYANAPAPFASLFPGGFA
jgi:hypothetical protein